MNKNLNVVINFVETKTEEDYRRIEKASEILVAKILKGNPNYRLSR